MKICSLQNLFSHLQNAWQTSRPEEMVDNIWLEIPCIADVDNPADDAAFMKQIGATPRNHYSGDEKFELKNVMKDTLFVFAWHQANSSNMNDHSEWTLERKKKYINEPN